MHRLGAEGNNWLIAIAVTRHRNEVITLHQLRLLGVDVASWYARVEAMRRLFAAFFAVSVNDETFASGCCRVSVKIGCSTG
jgi:hypothetical protein